MFVEQVVTGDSHPRLFSVYFGAAAVAVGLYLVSLRSYVLFHSLIEIIGIVLAATIFVIAWNSRRFMRDGFLLFLGVSGLFVAILDTVHTLAYKGLGVFAAGGANLSSQLWIASRTLQGLSLLVAVLLIGRKLKENWLEFIFLAFVITDALAFLSIFQWHVFPATFIEGSGLTAFKITAEYAICAAFLASAFVLLGSRGRDLDPVVRRLLLVSIFLNIAAELSFTQYVSVYGPANTIGHILRFFSHVFIYGAIVEISLVRPYDLLFRQLKMGEEALTEQNVELEWTLTETELDRRTARLLIESIGDGVIAIDRYWNITLWNKAAERITGWSAEEAVGKPFRKIVTFVRAKDGTENVTFIEEAMLLGQVRVMEGDTSLLTKDGRRIPMGDSAAPIFDQAGVVKGAVIIFRDVSAEQELEEKEKTIAKLKDDFLFKTVHDLRSPSSIIKLVLATSEGTDAAKDPQMAKNLDYIRDANTRILKLIADLLSIGREANPLFMLECKPLALKSVLDAVLSEMSPKAAAKRIDLVRADTPEPPDVMANHDALNEVLVNLFDNAIKYNKEGGRVTIGQEVAGRVVRIWIQDTGPGISAEHREKLFQPYYRAGVGSDIEGSGLGLFIVKKLMEKMGGSVEVSSTAGEGTRLTLTLSLA